MSAQLSLADVAKVDAEALLAGLDPEQREVVLHDRGPALVVAGAGAGKCVTPDTYVWSDGLRRFGDIALRDGASIASGWGTRAIEGWHDDGWRDGLKITLECGASVDATPNHPLWTRRPDGFEGWIETVNLTTADYVAIGRGHADWGRRSMPLDEAYCLGLLIADGSVHDGNHGSNLQIDKQKIVLERVRDVVARWQPRAAGNGYGSKGRNGSVYIHEKNDNHAILAAYARDWKGFFRNEFQIDWSFSENRVVPPSILTATRDVVVAFLRGYFDGDGYCEAVRGIPAVSTASRTLAEQVFHLLMGLGVYCRLRTKPTKLNGKTCLPAHIVEIRDINAFAKEVGFTEYGISKDRCFKLSMERTRNTNIDIIPYAHHLMARSGRRRGLVYIFKNYATGYRRPSYQKLTELLLLMNDEDERSEVSRVLTEHRAWSRVMSIEPSYAHRIDCTVAEHHAFIGNSIVNHNTTAVTHRLAYLVSVRKITPARILCLTFTKKAAGEMAERAAKLIGHDGAAVHTFHSLARKILTADWAGFDRWTLDGERDDASEEPRGVSITYRTLVKDAVGYRGLKWRTADVEELMSFIELCKADGARPGSDEARKIADRRFESRRIPGRDPILSMAAYAVAENLRVQARLMTFSDWLVEAKELLETNETVRRKWQAKYDYLMVDESQDNCLTQTRIAEMLASEHFNIMMIGDIAQTVHAWRGASMKAIGEFVDAWKPTIIKLDRNYRSGRSIIELGNEIRASLELSESAQLVARGQRDVPGVVRVRGFGTQEDEARHVARAIQELHAEGVPYRDVFILYRTHALSRAHEEALAGEAVPYVVVGGTSFYARKEVRALCAYLRMATPGASRPDDRRRSLREPNRFLSAAFLDAFEVAVNAAPPGSTWASIADGVAARMRLTPSQASAIDAWGELMTDLRAVALRGDEARTRIAAKAPPEFAGNDDEDLSDLLPRATPDQLAADRGSPAALLRTIVERTGFLDWIEQDQGRDSVDNDRKSNVAELIRAAETFSTTTGLIEHVDHQLELRSQARREDGKDRVMLMSLHSVKGLERKHVFMVMCNDRVLPHSLAEDVESEKRLWYVGCTRARDALTLSYIRTASSGGKVRALAPSPFLPAEALAAEHRQR